MAAVLMGNEGSNPDLTDVSRCTRESSRRTAS
jgi:hypothetical protein